MEEWKNLKIKIITQSMLEKRYLKPLTLLQINIKIRNYKKKSKFMKNQSILINNIPELHQIYSWKNQYTLIIEYVQGANLHAILENHPNNQKRIARIIFQILDTLEYLHSLNIVHHDIKPQNIIFDPKSQIVKIFDFGQAVQLISQTQIVMNSGGTYAYFAPENFQDICSTKTDIWACGIILFYLLSGKIYFYQNNRQQMKKGILTKPVIFQGYAWNLYNSAVKDLILKMLEKDHTKRLSASEAKNHSWIVQNIKNWNNPSKNLVRSIMRSGKRSFSIEKESHANNQRKLSCELPTLMKTGSCKKLSRFCNN